MKIWGNWVSLIMLFLILASPVWVYRGQRESFTSQADAIFEAIWGGISKRPNI